MNSHLAEVAEYAQFSQRLEQIDWSPIAQLIAQTEGWSDRQLEQAMVRYQQFLFLVQHYPDQELVPDQETDLVLHAHFSMDRYSQDCQTLFGAALSHNDGFGGTDSEENYRSWMTLFNRTKELIQQQFNWAQLELLQPARCVVQLAL